MTLKLLLGGAVAKKLASILERRFRLLRSLYPRLHSWCDRGNLLSSVL